MFIAFSLTLMPYFYRCLMRWKTFLPFSKDHCNSHYSLISKARHILYGKGNKPAQKFWLDIQAQADHPTPRLSKKPTSGQDWWGAKQPWGDGGVFASQHCHSSMESLLDLKTQEDDRDSSSTLKLSTPLVWHREVAVPSASCCDTIHVHNHRAINASLRLLKNSDGSTFLEICLLYKYIHIWI